MKKLPVRAGDAGGGQLTGAVVDLGIPLISALNPALGVALALFQAGKGIVAGYDGEALRRDVEVLRSFVRRVERRIRSDCELTAGKAREVLRRPDIVRLLHEARDVYALSQYESRLDRFASVLAGRAPPAEAHRDIEEPLLFARAALELNDEVVAFMALARAS